MIWILLSKLASEPQESQWSIEETWPEPERDRAFFEINTRKKEQPHMLYELHQIPTQVYEAFAQF